MLKFLRRRDTVMRWALGGFLVLIAVSMLLYLIPGNGSNLPGMPNSQAVASVDGVDISADTLNRRIADMAGNQELPAGLRPMFGRQVLQNLVTQQALIAEAHSLGLTASDDEVAQLARTSAPGLYPGGVYVGDDKASQALQQANQGSLADFQDALRDQVLTIKVYNLVTDPVRVGDDAILQQIRKQTQKIKFDYVAISPDDVAKDVPITDAALQDYYKKNLAKYMSQEKRGFEVLLANTTQIAASISITDAQINTYYNQNMAQFSVPERVKASHILISTTDANQKPLSPADVAKARATAEDVLKQLKAGADFATLAKKYSKDPGSAANGGELGYFQRGQMVKPFDDAAFSLPVGQTSGIVQSEFGFHIIKVEAHDKAHLQTEAEVHDQIVHTLQTNLATEQMDGIMSRAQSQLNAHASMAEVASQLHLQYFKTDPITRTDPVTGIGVNQDFANAIFSTPVGGVTAPVAVAQGIALGKVDQILPAAQEPFDAAKAAVTTDYKQDQSAQLAKTRAQQVADAAQKEGLKAAAAAQHQPVKSSDAVTEDGSLPDLGSISSFGPAIAALKPGQSGGPMSTGNKQVVYSLDSVTPASAADISSQYNTVSQQLLDQERRNVFQAYADALVASLEKKNKIKFNDAVFQQVTGGGQSGSSGGSGN